MNCETFRDQYTEFTKPTTPAGPFDLVEWQAWQEHALACSSCYEWDLHMGEAENKTLAPVPCSHFVKRLTLEQGEVVHPHNCPGNLITLDRNTKTYGLPISDSATTMVAIHFCPWCGTKLENS